MFPAHFAARALRSVVFIDDLTERGAFRPRGTAFLVGIPSSKEGLAFPYLVTAQHVVVMLEQRRRQVYLRANHKDGTAKVEPLNIERWWYHPDPGETTDVAAYLASLYRPILLLRTIVWPLPLFLILVAVAASSIRPHRVAAVVLALLLCIQATGAVNYFSQSVKGAAAVHVNFDLVDHEPILMPEKWEPHPSTVRRGIGLGDETFAIGLFRKHMGTQRNVPIVRIGNVAALPGELIATRWGPMKGYLVEMRSIAGLSGSPVFADSPRASGMFWGGGGTFIPDPRYNPPDPNETLDWFQYQFLGLIHGHFDIPNLTEDSVVEDEDAGTPTGINTGIGVVIPADKIIETLYQPELIAERQALEARFDSHKAATPDDDAP